jgi:hypothetical protein
MVHGSPPCERLPLAWIGAARDVPCVAESSPLPSRTGHEIGNGRSRNAWYPENAAITAVRNAWNSAAFFIAAGRSWALGSRGFLVRIGACFAGISPPFRRPIPMHHTWKIAVEVCGLLLQQEDILLKERYAASGTVTLAGKLAEASGIPGYFDTDGEAQQAGLARGRAWIVSNDQDESGSDNLQQVSRNI